jgi:ribonuclease J
MSIPKDELLILPLGGIAHVTQNMYVYQYQNEILIIDCGIGFPDIQMPGVDILIPDISYLHQQLDQGKKIVGMVLSHGHDDHIAALPYILPNLPDFPIYASRLTAGFASSRLLDEGNVHPITETTDRERVTIGEHFAITPFAITHSVPDTKHFLLETPVGNIYHGSDFKLDPAPVDNVLPDYEFMEQIKTQGVKLMLTDCLGTEKPEWTASETSVGPVLEKEMIGVKGKCLVTLMSSHIHRIKQVLDLAHKLKRKVALIGRSVEQNVLIAAELGFIADDNGVIINKKDLKNYPDYEIILIIAGSQGQEGSSLVRAIYGEHREVRITPDDKVIFSADAIPGNELSYYGAIDELCINNVEVVYPAINQGIHQSGHARRPELADLVKRITPAKIFPIGGNNRHRVKYRDLIALPLGYQPHDVILPNEGDILALTADGAIKKAGNVNLRPQIVDGLGVGDVGTVVLSDRRVLGQAGIILILIKRYQNKNKAGKLKLNKFGLAIDDIIVISRGFVFMKNADDVVNFIKKRTGELIAKHYDPKKREQSERAIERGLARNLYEIIQREPMIEVEIINV